MIKVFVVQSELGHYYSKQGAWLSGKDSSSIYYGKYKDEALNQLIDITIKDVDIRARVIEVALNEKKLPVLDIITDTDLVNPELSDEQGEEATEPSLAIA